MVDILRTAVSGLMASRTAMGATSHNVANVNTPYYSRQRVELGTPMPEKYSYGYMGRGVDVEGITRAYDEFLMKQLRGHGSGVSQYDTLHELTGQMSALLGDTEVGLTPDLETFFGAMQDLANSPASIPARQVFLDEARTLTTRAQDIDSALSSLRKSVDTGIRNAVTTVNDLTAGIARINQDIVQATKSPTNSPNDLLDNRDRLLMDLSKMVGLQVVAQDDGAINVFMGSGQPLVVGNNAYKLEAVPSGFNPQETTVRLEGQAKGSDLERYITNGQLGGYFEFRRTILNPAQDGLGLLAMGLAETFNDQHQRGMDLNGDLGAKLFEVGAPKVLSHSNNQGDARFAAALNDTTGPYELSYDQANDQYTLRRLSDGETFAPFALEPPVTVDGVTRQRPVTVDGIVIHWDGVTPPTDGDKFLLQPNARGTATSIPYNGSASANFSARSVTTTDSSQLVRSDYEILTSGVAGRASSTNAGTATISTPGVVDARQKNFTHTVRIEFTDPTTYDVIDITTGTALASGQAYTSGGLIPSTGHYNGWSVRITAGAEPIAAGDTFEVSAGYTVTRLADNREILSGGDFTALNDTLRGQGLHLTLTDTPPGGPPRYEDRFLIQPTRQGAPSFAVAIDDPRQIAAAAPIVTHAWADNVSSTTISAGTVVDAGNPNLQNAVRIQFTSASEFNIVDLDTGVALATNRTYASGEPITYNGWSVNITGSPRGNVSGEPVVASASPTNQGSATIMVDAASTEIYNENLLNTVEIRFTSATQFDVFDIAKGTTLASGVNYITGDDISYNGWTVQISDGFETPQPGDVFQIKNDGDAFTIRNNIGGIGDNRNALELVKLETKPQLLNGSDYRGVYVGMIAEVGAQGRRVENTLRSQEALFEQSTMARESVSGVNLDEEAANLVRFQQAYEASAQMIQTANAIFKTLLDAVRS